MKGSDVDERPEILKTDALGRVQTTREHREVILDEFDRSGLSGPKFAEAHGINYQTFATWRQNRKRAGSEDPVIDSGRTSEIRFFEVTAPELTGTSGVGSGLIIELPGGVRMIARRPEEAALAAEVIRGLNP